MNYVATSLPDVWIVELERHSDDRGYFARSWCEEEFRARGLNPRLAQCSVSFNARRGTLRGMHYQAAPHAEAKLVRCTRGAVHDVVLDLRPESKSFKQWITVELNEDNGRAVYIPEGCAHGFQTLTDNTEVLYQISEFHHPQSSRGVRWDEPAFGIVWPIENPILSGRDQHHPLFQPGS
jgi:dTDP-4-dehydrorhamnose 3,5-epimerase